MYSVQECVFQSSVTYLNLRIGMEKVKLVVSYVSVIFLQNVVQFFSHWKHKQFQYSEGENVLTECILKDSILLIGME